jgi:hypothetical protein
VPGAAAVGATPLHSPHQHQPPPPTPVPRAPKRQLLAAAMSRVDGIELVRPRLCNWSPTFSCSPLPHFSLDRCQRDGSVGMQPRRPLQSAYSRCCCHGGTGDGVVMVLLLLWRFTGGDVVVPWGAVVMFVVTIA